MNRRRHNYRKQGIGGIGESMSNAITAAHLQSLKPEISYDLGLEDADKKNRKKKGKR